MFYDKLESMYWEGWRHHEHRGPFGRGRQGRHGLHSGRKLSSSELQFILLALMEKTPSHGYELIKSLEERSDGFYVPSPGMIYPALTYLEEVGYASVEVNGTKKRYMITESGTEHLEKNRSHVEQILEDLERIGSRMAQARRAIAGELNDEEDEGADAPFGGMRMELRRTLREHLGGSAEDRERVQEILHRAIGEIRHAKGHRRDRESGPGPIGDPLVKSVIARLAGERSEFRGHHRGRERGRDENRRETAGQPGYSIDPKQGELMYLLCRSNNARRVAEFGTSVGLSTVYLATAVRDNGGGVVIGSEIEPEKVKIARKNLEDAGVSGLVEIREGDARETLRDLGGLVDLLLIDGWPVKEGPSLARQVIEFTAPQVRLGGIVINDNAEPDFLEYIRDPANGFVSMTLPIKGGTEFSVKVK